MKISLAIDLSRECYARPLIVSPGVTPNTTEVWDLLWQKYRKGPHPSLPISWSPPVTHVLPHDFDILSVLHSFPKGTAAALQGFTFSICLILLRSIYPLLFVPLCVVSWQWQSSIFGVKVSGRLFSHCISEEQGGASIGHSPFSSCEALRRLQGKCLCIIIKLLILLLLFNIESLALLKIKGHTQCQKLHPGTLEK